jgi:short subunit dehydrogenase-like uncharacterized protein
MQRKGEMLSEINFYDEINGTPSGGTLATALHILHTREKVTTRLGFDPLLKTVQGEKSLNRFITANPMLLSYSTEHQCFTTPFVMAIVMANCVRRSNALNNYSTKLTYR